MLFLLPLRVNSGRGEAALPRLLRLLLLDHEFWGADHYATGDYASRFASQ